MNRSWLISKREGSEKSQEEVATEAGISRQYYGMIENGSRNPSVEVAKRIATALGFNWTLFFNENSNDVLLMSERVSSA